MRSPGLALGWQLWHRNNVLFATLVVFGIAAGVVTHVFPEAFHAQTADDPPRPTLAFIFVAVVTAMVTSFATSRETASKDAPGIPAWMLRLPVRTGVLVGWPMFYGAVVVALAWVAWCWLVVRPGGFPAPLLWPAILFAAGTSWLQVCMLDTRPCGHRWLENCLALGFVALGVGILIEQTASRPGEPHFLMAWAVAIPDAVLVAVFAVMIPAAYVAGVGDLARLRSGSTALPARHRYWDLPGTAAWLLPRPHWPFASPAAAQCWLEWRLHGSFLPLCWLTIQGYCLLGAGVYSAVTYVFHLESPGDMDLWGNLWWGIPGLVSVMGLLASPVFVFDLEKPMFPSFGTLSPLVAVRPISTGALVVAKLQVIALSLLLTWTLAVLQGGLLYFAFGNQAALTDWLAGNFPPSYRMDRGAFLAVISVGGFVVLWVVAVQHLLFGLTGRAGTIIASATCHFCVFFIALFAIERWVANVPVLLDSLHRPSLGLVAVAGLALSCKGVAAAWAINAIHQRRLLATRTLGRLLGVWLLACIGLVAFFAMVLPAGMVPLPWIACGTVLVLPLARIACAPLALAWNRHR